MVAYPGSACVIKVRCETVNHVTAADFGISSQSMAITESFIAVIVVVGSATKGC